MCFARLFLINTLSCWTLFHLPHHPYPSSSPPIPYPYTCHRNIWSSRGCYLNYELSNATFSVCECYHLTHFAILLSPRVEVSIATTMSSCVVLYIFTYCIDKDRQIERISESECDRVAPRHRHCETKERESQRKAIRLTDMLTAKLSLITFFFF